MNEQFEVGDRVRIKLGAPGMVDHYAKLATVRYVYKSYNEIGITLDDGTIMDLPAASVTKVEEESKNKYATGVKFDNGKPKISLAPSCAILGMLESFGYGAEKYEEHNYRKGYEWTRALDAAVRHILAELDGEEKDAESGLEHWKHALACIAMYAEFKTNNVGRDDRYKREA